MRESLFSFLLDHMPLRTLDTILHTNEIMYPSCPYWETRGKTTTRRFGHSCFGQLNYADGLRAIRHLCMPQPFITEEHLRFWIRCLKHWLPGLRWSARIIRVAARDGVRRTCILYRLEPAPGDRRRTLTYLTMMRMPHMQGAIVRALYDRRAECADTDELFRLMQRLHYQNAVTPGACYEHGESLVCRRSWAMRLAPQRPVGDHYPGWDNGSFSSEEPVPLPRFLSNLAAGGRPTVHSYFA